MSDEDELRRTEERLRILDGLLVAVDDPRGVLDVIVGAADRCCFTTVGR